MQFSKFHSCAALKDECNIAIGKQVIKIAPRKALSVVQFELSVKKLL